MKKTIIIIITIAILAVAGHFAFKWLVQSRNSRETFQPEPIISELALQYSRLEKELDKATFCLRNYPFFCKAPSDDEIRAVFGEDANLPSITTNQSITDVRCRSVVITLWDRPFPRDGQAPLPWVCYAYYEDNFLVRFFVEPLNGQK